MVWKNYFKMTILLGLPLVLLPLIIVEDTSKNSAGIEIPSQKLKCLYVMILMAIYWMVEAMPLPVTAVIPIVLFPIFGIQSTAAVSLNYMRESNTMFIGGITIALAIQYSNLHKRIALAIIILIGSSPWRLLLGVMSTTTFLSFWIVNTAVTAMMIPIVSGIIEGLNSRANGLEEKETSKVSSLRKMYMLSVAYASNIGGTAVIIGSNPNLILQELVSTVNIGQNGKYTDLNFNSWIAYNMPIALINVFICWIYLAIRFLGLPKSIIFWKRKPHKKPSLSQSQQPDLPDTSIVKQMLKQKYKELGPINFHEAAVFCLFVAVIILWFLRDPSVFPGWTSLLSHKVKIGDSTVAIGIMIFLFVIPKDLKTFQSGKYETLMSWEYAQANFPWGLILLMGGGFALSDGSIKSGLSDWIGEQLTSLQSLSNPVILAIVMIFSTLFTELASNASVTNLLVPILLSLSKRLDLHPLFLTLPGTISCQYAFMLPVSNPPNAIVFAAGRMKILDMVTTGAFLNFSCLLVLFLMNISWGQVIFNYSDYSYPLNCTGDNCIG